MIGRFQYQTLAAPFEESQALETREGFLQHPDPVRRRGITAALLVGALVVAPVFVPAEDAVANPGGGFVSTGQIPTFQYQGIAGPLFIETVAAFPDSPYALSYPARLSRPRQVHPSSQPAFFFDRFAAPDAVSVPANSWTPRYPDRLSPLRGLGARYQPVYVSDRADPPTADTSPVLSWGPRYRDRHTYRRPLAPYVWAEQHFGVIVEVPVMSWTGLYLDPPVKAKSRRQLQTLATQPFDVEGTISPPAPALSWSPTYPAKVYPKRRALATLAAETNWNIFQADVTVIAPDASWQGRYSDRVPAKLGLRIAIHPAFFCDRFDPPDPVTAPDLAAPVYVDRVAGRTPIVRPSAGVAPLFVPDVTEPPSNHSWDGLYSELVWARRVHARHAPVWASSIFITDVTSPAPPLSWKAIYPDRIHRRTMLASAQDDLNWNTEVPPIVVVTEAFGRGRYTVAPRRRVFIVPPRRRDWIV